jgi:predicted PurR-regulated permease PerM
MLIRRQADRERLTSALYLFVAGLLLYLMYLVFEPFLVPLGWAAVLAIVFQPVHARFERRWGPSRAAAVSTAVVGLIVVVPIVTIMTAFVREAIEAGGTMQRAFVEGRLGWMERAWEWLQQRSTVVPQVDIAGAAADVARRLAAFLAAQAGALLQNIALFVFNLSAALFAAYFMFRDRDAIMLGIRKVLPLDEQLRERLLEQTGTLVSASLISAGVVAAVQGLLGGLAFAVLGISAPIFWGVVMGFFCLLPFGAWVIWLPAAGMLVAGGDVARGLILAGFGVGVVSAVDNFLRPMLLSGRSGMNGLLVFISLLGGLRVFGSLGLVLGPTLVALGIGLIKTFTMADAAQQAEVPPS